MSKQAIAADLHFKRMPSPTAGFLRAAVSRGSGVGPDRSIPPLQATLRNITPDAEHVRRYARLCGYRPGNLLPLAYPHVLAAPLHLAVLTHKAFPLRLLGVVHVRNHVVQERPIGRAEALDIQVRVEGHREVGNGIEFDLETYVRDNAGTCVWHSTSTNLVRGRGNGSKGQPWEPPRLDEYEQVAEWALPDDLGRRYGWLAGDINPIHLHPLSARLFGFRRHIAHGMWTFSRCAAALLEDEPEGRVEMDVAFRRPVFLPAKVQLFRRERVGETAYALTDTQRATFHLTGTLKA